jgi:hypothetical protein
MRTIFLSLILTGLFACGESVNNENAETVKTDSAQQQKTEEPAPTYDCYIQVLKRDTMVACLQVKGNVVTGKLTFNNFEKDRSSGNVHGMIEGDIIKLWYEFASEGMNSVMEVYFKKEDSRLLRGTGPVGTKADTAYFSDKDAIEYKAGQAFNKIPCESIAEKYRCQ